MTRLWRAVAIVERLTKYKPMKWSGVYECLNAFQRKFPYGGSVTIHYDWVRHHLNEKNGGKWGPRVLTSDFWGVFRGQVVMLCHFCEREIVPFDGDYCEDALCELMRKKILRYDGSPSKLYSKTGNKTEAIANFIRIHAHEFDSSFYGRNPRPDIRGDRGANLREIKCHPS
jgi:hypothetical protein